MLVVVVVPSFVEMHHTGHSPGCGVCRTSVEGKGGV